MKTRVFFAYAICGAVFGAISGIAGAAAFRFHGGQPGWAFALAVGCGLLFGVPGAIMGRSKQAALFDPAVGAAFGAAAYALAKVVYSAGSDLSPNSVALGYVAFAFVFPAVLAAAHLGALREKRAFPAGVAFAGTAGLVSLVLAVQVVRPETWAAASIVSGAIFGLLVWGAISLAVKLLGADIDQFRV